MSCINLCSCEWNIPCISSKDVVKQTAVHIIPFYLLLIIDQAKKTQKGIASQYLIKSPCSDPDRCREGRHYNTSNLWWDFIMQFSARMLYTRQHLNHSPTTCLHGFFNEDGMKIEPLFFLVDVVMDMVGFFCHHLVLHLFQRKWIPKQISAVLSKLWFFLRINLIFW